MYLVYTYDGRWARYARVRPENLGRTLGKLYRLAYGPCSIDVRDEGTGESLPGAEWPGAEFADG